MKFTTAALASSLAATTLAATPDSSTTYNLRIKGSTNPSIDRGLLAIRDPSSAPGNLGIWLTDRVFREPYGVTFKPASDPRFYEAHSTTGNTMMLSGLPEALTLIDVADPDSVEVSDGLQKFVNQWVFVDGLLRHGQDSNSQTPVGGAGSWRACKGDTVNDYQMYWYDGSSPLPYKNCEGVSLELVPVSNASSTSTTSASSTGTSSPTGFTTTGAGYPTATRSANTTTPATPSASPFDGAASRSGMGAGAAALCALFGVLALVM